MMGSTILLLMLRGCVIMVIFLILTQSSNPTVSRQFTYTLLRKSLSGMVDHELQKCGVDIVSDIDTFYRAFTGFDSVMDIQYMLDQTYLTAKGLDNHSMLMVYQVLKNCTLNDYDYRPGNTIGIDSYGVVYMNGRV